MKKDSDGSGIQSFQYGSTNARVLSLDHASTHMTIYAATGGTTLAEYIEFMATVPTWTKTYTYLGSSQVATVTPNGTGGEYVEFNNPDRLGTRLMTNQQQGTSYEQAHLPFGTALASESTRHDNNKRFTSYDRSPSTGLDYAINRTYDSKQGRFTQVDPIGMSAVSLAAPQTLNVYTYCGNDPINYVDPSGLFWGFFKKLFKWLMVAVAVVIAVISVVGLIAAAKITVAMILGTVAAIAGAASQVLGAFGLRKAALIFGLIAMAAGMGDLLP